MGKGSQRRPSSISYEEEQLRWDYAFGKIDITEEEFNRRLKKIRGKQNGTQV